MFVYLDNNATTRPDPRVVQAMLPFLEETWGNPSSTYRFGQQARQAVDEARHRVAAAINAADAEITFTGGGTESVNTAIRGILSARAPRKKLVTSSVEHSAGRELAAQLGREGFEIVTIAVDSRGVLDLDALKSALDDSVALVNIMWANNETGVIFPVEQIGAMCREHRIPFHCDGTQAMGKIPVDVKAANFDAMSFAAHKFHGPKGVGSLYLRRGTRLRSLVIGGPQEHSHRGGTENVPGIVGMGKAAELLHESLEQMPRIAGQRDRLEKSILQAVPQTVVNGGSQPRVPNTTNISFARLEADAILLLFSDRGLCASAGSACSSGSLEPSFVLQAMKLDPAIAHGAIRFSLSKFTTDAEIDAALQIIPQAIAKLRESMPEMVHA